MEEFSFLDWILTNWQTAIVGIISGIITITSIIVKLTPTEVDDEKWFKILQILEKLSLNNSPVTKK